MSVSVNISGTIIEIPSAGASPDWAPAIIAFCQAVEAALSGVVGPFDVPPQVFNIDAYNPGVDVSLPNFSFPISDVRGVIAPYTVYRNTTTTTVAEVGEIQAVYNPDGPSGNKWNVSRDKTGDAFIEFEITDNGQVTFTTTAIGGSSHVGRVSYSAKAILQDTA